MDITLLLRKSGRSSPRLCKRTGTRRKIQYSVRRGLQFGASAEQGMQPVQGSAPDCEAVCIEPVSAEPGMVYQIILEIGGYHRGLRAQAGARSPTVVRDGSGIRPDGLMQDDPLFIGRKEPAVAEQPHPKDDCQTGSQRCSAK